jgi:cell wall-associated NlpC family hydrolase
VRNLPERSEIVVAAQRWLRTPYHPRSAVLGVGCDCGTLLLETYRAVGIVPPDFRLAYYSVQRALHDPQERYIGLVLQLGGREISESELGAGDVIAYKVGRAFGHGGIAIEWPSVMIHSTRAGGTHLTNGIEDGFLKGLARRYFTIFPPA